MGMGRRARGTRKLVPRFRAVVAYALEVNQRGPCNGLRRSIRTNTDSRNQLVFVHGSFTLFGVSARPTTLVWALLADADTCGLLLNRAIELISLGAVVPGSTPRAR